MVFLSASGITSYSADVHMVDEKKGCFGMENYGIENIKVLFEISTLVQSGVGMSEKFDKVVAMIRDSVGCHSVSLFIYAEDEDSLEEVATVGSRVDLIESIHFDMGKGFSAWVAKQRRSVLIPNLREGREGGFRSFISTPLLAADRLIGVLNLGHEEPDTFTERHMEFLDIVAAQLAHTIERDTFERALIEKNEALTRARREIELQQKKIVDMEKKETFGQMAISINHEINNPLTTILGNIELILMINPDLDEKTKKKLETVQKEARRIGDIVDKLKNAKKIVTTDYIRRHDEKMIDLDSSLDGDSGEIISS